MSSASDSADNGPPITRIDLKKYRTGEMAERIGDTIGVPRLLINFLNASVVFFIIFLICVFLYLEFVDVSGLKWALVTIYAGLTGIFLAFGFGLIRIAHRSLRNIDEILQIILSIAGNASADYASIKSGATKLPSSGQIVAQVYEEVFLPTMEKVIASQFRFIGTPILWIYQKTIGSAVRRIITITELKRVDSEQLAEFQTAVADSFESVAEHSHEISKKISPISERLRLVTRRLRLYIITPLLLFFCVVTLVAIAPIMLAHFFS